MSRRRRTILPHLVLRVTRANQQQLQRPQVAQPLARRANDFIQEGLAELGENTAIIEHPGETKEKTRVRKISARAGDAPRSTVADQEIPSSALAFRPRLGNSETGTGGGENAANLTKFSYKPQHARKVLRKTQRRGSCGKTARGEGGAFQKTNNTTSA